MRSWVWNLFVARNQRLICFDRPVFLQSHFYFFKQGHHAFLFLAPFCCDGLALLEQWLHALSFCVSLLPSLLVESLLVESLLAGFLFFAWLFFSLWISVCSCKIYSLLRILDFYQICLGTSKLQLIRDALTFIHDRCRYSRSEWRFCPQGCSVACEWDQVICLFVFHPFCFFCIFS